MQLFLPQQNHSRFGVVRTVVKDVYNDNPGFESADDQIREQVFLDSDGHVSDNKGDAEFGNTTQALVCDGAWHMATVTTQPDASVGFLLYVDGKLAGNMQQGTYPGKPTFDHHGYKNIYAVRHG